jgi:hypothetical protein
MGFTSEIVSGRDPEVLYLGNPTGISAYADQQTDAANTFLLRLGETVANLSPPTINPVFPPGPSAPPQEAVSPPDFQPIVWVSPDAPAAFTEELDVTSMMPDPFDEDPPSLNFGSAPTAFSEEAPTAPGINLVFEDPGLTVDLPAAPDLLSISVRPFDGMNLPTIDPDAVSTRPAPSTRLRFLPASRRSSRTSSTTAAPASSRPQRTPSGTAAASARHGRLPTPSRRSSRWRAWASPSRPASTSMRA